VDTSTHHLSAFGHHVTIGTGFPIYEGGEEGLLPSVNILRFHRSTLASTIQTTFSKVSTDLIPAAPLWLRDSTSTSTSSIRFPEVVTYRCVLKTSCGRLVSAAWSSWTLEIYLSLSFSLASGLPKCDVFTLWTIEVLYVAVQV
jgi:hypothetical protein